MVDVEEDVEVPAVVPVVVPVVDVVELAVEEADQPVLRVEPRSSSSHTDTLVFSSPVERKIFSSQRT